MNIFKNKYLGITIQIIALVIIISTIWCVIYQRTSIEVWKVPLVYESDALKFLAISKAFQDGDIVPIFQKNVKNLNAPFEANWNDWPITEELVFATIGWLGRIFGLFASANLVVLLSQILAGISFWAVARVIKCKWEFALVGGVLYAFSPYLLTRNLLHVQVTVCFHVPLFLLVSWWAFSRDKMKLWDSYWWFAAVVSLVTGILSPYYSFIYIQFLIFALLYHLLNKNWIRAKFPYVWLVLLLRPS